MFTIPAEAFPTALRTLHPLCATDMPSQSHKARRALDLSFPPFDQDHEVTLFPGDLAVLLVGISARQAASPTAVTQAGFERADPDPRLFAPLDGAFNGPMAAVMAQWREG